MRRKSLHFYHANLKTKTLEKLEICSALSDDEKQAWGVFITTFDSMEMNSGRRLSDAEHQLITKVFQLQCPIQREGIQYEHHGKRYRDSRSPFNLITTLRTCIRLYEEAEQNGQWDKANAYWRTKVGKAQGEEMWLLQRICEKDRPFYPLPTNFNGFKRTVMFYDSTLNKEVSAVADGKTCFGLGPDFALFKVKGRECGARVRRTASGCP